MGLTERHWFENEDVPENYEWALEDAVSRRQNIDEKNNFIKCLECNWQEHCPVMHSYLNAACITIQKKKQDAVVRCKDCKYCIKEPNGELYCDLLAIGYEPLGSKKVIADWFCADGERR